MYERKKEFALICVIYAGVRTFFERSTPPTQLSDRPGSTAGGGSQYIITAAKITLCTVGVVVVVPVEVVVFYTRFVVQWLAARWLQRTLIV